jgi:beta-lactamase family protein
VSRRLAVAAGLVGAAAALAVGGLHAGGSARRTPPSGACRDWVEASAYRGPIAAARMLVPKMKRAFAAPGLSVAVAADGKLVWSESCGFADLRRRVPVGRATEFRIGSVAKTSVHLAADEQRPSDRLRLRARGSQQSRRRRRRAYRQRGRRDVVPPDPSTDTRRPRADDEHRLGHGRRPSGPERRARPAAAGVALRPPGPESPLGAVASPSRR